MRPLRPPTTFDPVVGRRFVLEVDRRLERIDRNILRAEWDLSVGASSEGSDRWQLRRAELLSDPDLLEWVRRALRRPWSAPIHRRLQLLERILLDARVEQLPEVVRLRGELQRRITEFRPRWKGRRVGRGVVDRIARESPRPRERQAAYYSLEPLHRPMEESLRRLVRLRNDGARALGFRSYAEMRLGFLGLTPSRLDELAEEAVVPARAQLKDLKASFEDAAGGRGWHPWDLPFARRLGVPLPERAFSRARMMERVLAAVGAWGFRTDRMRFRVVFHDLPSGGMTLAPDPPRDVRIQVHPAGGWMAYVVLFHEVGHAVHSASIRAPRHLLRWHENVPGFGAFHEGIGGLFEEIPCEPAWLERLPGIDPERARAFADRAHRTGAIDAAWHASWIRVEQALYRDPERDPMPASMRWTRRVFGYDAFDPLSFVDPFFVDLPVYAPNYLLAMLFGAQVRATLRRRFGDPVWPNRSVGPWLTRHWLAPGSTFDWLERLKETTGRGLGAAAFRAEFAH